MEIRPYTPDDCTELLEAWYQASLQGHSFLSADFLEDERGRIADVWLPIADTFVCEVGGRVVGFVSLLDSEVGGLFVAPEFQRCGYGSALLAAARDGRSRLELSVFAANVTAREFYAACGFVAVAEGTNEATGFPEVRMVWSGDPDG